jgi:hypothetical protein
MQECKKKEEFTQSKLTEDELLALIKYTSATYLPINKYLRSFLNTTTEYQGLNFLRQFI